MPGCSALGYNRAFAPFTAVGALGTTRAAPRVVSGLAGLPPGPAPSSGGWCLPGGTGGPDPWRLSAELRLPGGPGDDRIRMRRGDGVQDPDDVGILHLPEHL